jgi:small subunit ribosomal protein S1
MIVAIDGPAGSGKSSVASLVARRLGFTLINSGNYYRAISLKCSALGISPDDEEGVLRVARECALEDRGEEFLLDGRDVAPELHSDAVDAIVSPISAIRGVRERVNELLRAYAASRDCVAEGRDMTTVVFPSAEVKFYLDASIDARVARRSAQGYSSLDPEELRESIAARDASDKAKPFGALKRAPDAEYLDTSDLTIDEVYEKVVRKIHRQGNTMGQLEAGMNDKKPAQDNIQIQLQEEYLKSLDQLEEGQLVDGRVVEITPDQVFVDVGYKSEGKIPLDEFDSPPSIGDVVSVVLVRKENREGEVIVSKRKADEKSFWKVLRNNFQEKLPVTGTISKIVKGGYDVDMGFGVHAFLPISQADVQRVDKPEKLLGIKSSFYIDRLYSDNKVNIVVTRRNWLEEETERARNEFFAKAQIGDEVTGVVKSFTSFGAFIDLGGFDGLLHINDMSWGHVARPRDFVKKGQEITVKVIRMDPEEKRINLSLKHFTEDPWYTFEERYHVNDVVKGKVTKLTDFGAFIELEEGIEGLAHISEFSWTRKIRKPEEVLSVGDEVEVMILGYDLQNGKVSLGLKQVTNNPWDSVSEKYPVGMRLKRKIVKVTNAGAFVELEEGIDGFLHVDELSWTKKIKNAASELKVGDEIEVIVIDSDAGNRNIRLGVKQLSEDPWESFRKAFKVGSAIEGEVVSITDFGIFLRVQGGIEGLINKQNLTDDRDEPYEETCKKFKVGDKLNVVITDINVERQKIGFSLKDYAKKVQREEISRYMHEDEAGEEGFTLGDLIKRKEKSED